MNAKRKEAKQNYEAFKSIRDRIVNGEQVSFAERNIYHIVLKKQMKKKSK
jgi:predicted ester cyclase